MDKIFSSGGRVLTITAMGKSIKIARNRVYSVLKKLNWKPKINLKEWLWEKLCE